MNQSPVLSNVSVEMDEVVHHTPVVTSTHDESILKNTNMQGNSGTSEEEPLHPRKTTPLLPPTLLLPRTPPAAGAPVAPKKPRVKKPKVVIVEPAVVVDDSTTSPVASVAPVAPAPKKPRAKKPKVAAVAAAAVESSSTEPVETTTDGLMPPPEAPAAPKKPRAKKPKVAAAVVTEATHDDPTTQPPEAPVAPPKKPRAKKPKAAAVAMVESSATEDSTATPEEEEPTTQRDEILFPGESPPSPSSHKTIIQNRDEFISQLAKHLAAKFPLIPSPKHLVSSLLVPSTRHFETSLQTFFSTPSTSAEHVEVEPSNEEESPSSHKTIIQIQNRDEFISQLAKHLAAAEFPPVPSANQFESSLQSFFSTPSTSVETIHTSLFYLLPSHLQSHGLPLLIDSHRNLYLTNPPHQFVCSYNDLVSTPVDASVM